MSTFFRREDVVGKTVVDASGKILGKVTDIGFDLKGNLVMVIGDEEEQNYVFFSNIQAVGDVVLLKTVGLSGSGGISHEAPSQTVEQPPQPAPTTQEMSPQPQPETVIYCPECGHPNSPSNRFCENCGTKLAEEEGGLLGGFKKVFKR